MSLLEDKVRLYSRIGHELGRSVGIGLAIVVFGSVAYGSGMAIVEHYKSRVEVCEKIEYTLPQDSIRFQ